MTMQILVTDWDTHAAALMAIREQVFIDEQGVWGMQVLVDVPTFLMFGGEELIRQKAKSPEYASAGIKLTTFAPSNSSVFVP